MRDADWQTADGSIRLYHGDCRDYLDDLRVEVDCVVTDPPYGIFAHGGKWGRKGDLEWDRPENQPDVSDLLLLGGEQVIWGGNYFSLPPSRGWLVWLKRDAVPSAADCELAWTSLNMNARVIDQTIAATNPERNGHPTMKPLRVMEWSLSFVSDGVTFDPFMGSGTTGVACVRLGRKFIGIEKERKYFDIAVDRITKELNRMRLFEPPPKIISRKLPGMEELT